MGTSTREITFNRSLFKVQSACQRTSHRSSAQARPGEYSRRRPLLLRSARLACGSAVAPGVQCSASGRWAPLLRLTRRSRPDMRCPRVWCHAMASGHAPGGDPGWNPCMLSELRTMLCGSRCACDAARNAGSARVLCAIRGWRTIIRALARAVPGVVCEASACSGAV